MHTKGGGSLSILNVQSPATGSPYTSSIVAPASPAAAMDFFGDYTITLASRPAASATSPTDSVSDLASPISPGAPGFSHTHRLANVTDLERCFNLQSLDGTSSDNDFDSTLASFRNTHVGTSSCWKRRMQRQSNVRLLTDPAHLRSISDMVEKMVDEQDQCGVSRRRVSLTIDVPSAEEAIDDESSSCTSASPRSILSCGSSSSRQQCSMSPTGTPSLGGDRRILQSPGSPVDSRVRKGKITKKSSRRRS